MPDDLDSNIDITKLGVMTAALRRGRLVPFLGAGTNLCDRPKETVWHYGDLECLPSACELAEHLASVSGYPDEEPRQLLRVA